MIKKIILGTANFGLTMVQLISLYKAGSSRKNFIKCQKWNFNLDTAPDYKNSEIILGKIGVSKFNISTKILIPEKAAITIRNFFTTLMHRLIG